MYLPPANFQQFTINDYDSVTVLVMTFFTVGFQPEGPLKNEIKVLETHVKSAIAEAEKTPREKSKKICWLASAKDN